MAKQPGRVYWDACSWIAYIQREMPGPGKSFTEPRFDLCRATLKRAEDGQIEIVTSAFTLSEVCRSAEIKASPASNLTAFFEQRYILLVNVDRVVGFKAQALQLSGISGLKPQDATHLASALIADVPVLHTFDGKLLAMDERLETVGGRRLRILHPEAELPLPPLLEEIKKSASADEKPA